MKLSIIIPVYNLEAYIASTITSIQSIRFSYDYEILIVNDGSIDKSEEIIRKLQINNPQIRFVTIKNEGVSNARNIGLQMARGEYITFVDGDDEIEPDFYEIAVKELDACGYDFVQGNFRIIEGNKSYYNQRVNRTEEIEKKDVMLKKFCGVGKTIHNNVWGKVYRAELAKSVVFDRSISIAEDQKYVFDILIKAKKIKLFDCDAYRYYQRAASAMHTVSDNRILDQIKVCRYMKSLVKQDDIQTDIEKSEIICWLELYVKNVREHNNVEKYYRAIKKFRLKSVRSKLSNKDFAKIILIRCAPTLSRIIIRIKEKNRNG